MAADDPLRPTAHEPSAAARKRRHAAADGPHAPDLRKHPGGVTPFSTYGLAGWHSVPGCVRNAAESAKANCVHQMPAEIEV